MNRHSRLAIVPSLLLAASLTAAENAGTSPPIAPAPAVGDGKAATTPPPAPALSTDATIEVIGTHGTDIYPGGATTANKSGVPTLESPRRVDVISRDLIRELDATNATELWKLIPNAVEGERGTVIVRGFVLDQRPASGAQLFDGVRTSVYNLVPVSLYNVERVEVLKGPDGVMYGQGQPGGVVNYVLRKPQRESHNEFSLHADSYGKKQFAVDSTGTLAETAHGDFLFRVDSTGEQTETFRENEEFKNFRFAPAVSWIPSETTTVTLLSEWFKDYRTGGRGYGTPVRQHDPFAMPRDYSIEDPNDFRQTYGGDVQLQLNQRLSSEMVLDANLFASRCKYWNQYHEGQRNAAEDAADNPVYRRQYRDQTSDTKTYGYDVHGIWDHQGQELSHRLLIGTDYSRIDDPQFPGITALITNPASPTNTDGASPVNLDNPYLVPSGTGGYGVDTGEEGHGQFVEIGGYTNYRIGWQEQVFLDAGLRYDDFTQHAVDLNTIAHTVNFDVETRDQHFTYDAGAVWKFTKEASLYYGYSSGMVSQNYTSISNANGPFAPLQWSQHEVGVSAETPDKIVGAGVCAFRIDRNHDLVPDDRAGAPVGANIDVGHTRSDGFEASVRGALDKRTMISATYGYTHAYVSSSTQISTFDGNRIQGQELAGVPSHTANISLGHSLESTPVRLFAGWTYVGSKKAQLDTANPLAFKMPSYYTFDLGATYIQPSWQVRLGVTNIFDKDYAVLYRAPGNQVNRGDPQTFTASFTAWF